MGLGAPSLHHPQGFSYEGHLPAPPTFHWVLVCRHWQGFREVSVGLPAQRRHLLQLIRAWGPGRGLWVLPGYQEGHLRPACFLSLSAGGSFWDGP